MNEILKDMPVHKRLDAKILGKLSDIEQHLKALVNLQVRAMAEKEAGGFEKNGDIAVYEKRREILSTEIYSDGKTEDKEKGGK